LKFLRGNPSVNPLRTCGGVGDRRKRLEQSQAVQLSIGARLYRGNVAERDKFALRRLQEIEIIHIFA
jgi:hypothetical protein